MFGRGRGRALGFEDEENRNVPTRVAALGAGMAVADIALGGDPEEEDSWSVVMMRGGGIVGESLYRWGVVRALDGFDDVQDPGAQDADIPSEGLSVAAWPL